MLRYDGRIGKSNVNVTLNKPDKCWWNIHCKQHVNFLCIPIHSTKHRIKSRMYTYARVARNTLNHKFHNRTSQIMLSTYIGGHEIVDEVFCRGQCEREVLFLCAGETSCHRMSRFSDRCRTSDIGHGELCSDVSGIFLHLSFASSLNGCVVRGGGIAHIWISWERPTMERKKKCWNRNHKSYNRSERPEASFTNMV